MRGYSILYSKERGTSYNFNIKTEIIQLEPARRTIFYKDDLQEYTPIKKYNLPFPYILFGINHWLCKGARTMNGTLHVWFSNKPVEDIKNEKVYVPPMPNIEWQGKVCMSFMQCKNNMDVITEFFQTPFFFHNGRAAHVNFRAYLKVGQFDEWQNIESPLKVEWNQMNVKMLDVLLNS